MGLQYQERKKVVLVVEKGKRSRHEKLGVESQVRNSRKEERKGISWSQEKEKNVSKQERKCGVKESRKGKRCRSEGKESEA